MMMGSGGDQEIGGNRNDICGMERSDRIQMCNKKPFPSGNGFDEIGLDVRRPVG